MFRSRFMCNIYVLYGHRPTKSNALYANRFEIIFLHVKQMLHFNADQFWADNTTTSAW